MYTHLEWESNILHLPPSAPQFWGEPNGKVPRNRGI